MRALGPASPGVLQQLTLLAQEFVRRLQSLLLCPQALDLVCGKPQTIAVRNLDTTDPVELSACSTMPLVLHHDHPSTSSESLVYAQELAASSVVLSPPN
eukprot:3201579-Amphidinium_carterae.1